MNPTGMNPTGTVDLKLDRGLPRRLAPRYLHEVTLPALQRGLNMLDAFSVVAPVADVTAALRRRCAGVLDRVLPGFPPTLSGSAVTEIVDGLRQRPSRTELVG